MKNVQRRSCQELKYFKKLQTEHGSSITIRHAAYINDIDAVSIKEDREKRITTMDNKTKSQKSEEQTVIGRIALRRR